MKGPCRGGFEQLCVVQAAMDAMHIVPIHYIARTMPFVVNIRCTARHIASQLPRGGHLVLIFWPNWHSVLDHCYDNCVVNWTWGRR